MEEEKNYPAFCVTDADKAAYDVGRVGDWAEWITNYSDLRAIEQGCRFNIKRALYVRQFIESYLFIAPGQPFLLLPFQWKDIIAPIFGWCRADGKRRFTTAYIEIPKGHGKTLLAAAIGLAMMIADGCHRATVYAAARDKKQAGGVLTEAVNLVSNSKVLSRRCKLTTRPKVVHLLGKSGLPTASMEPLSKAPNNQGLSHTHCLIFEELHTFNDREAYGSLRYATSKVELGSNHDTPLMFSITTAGGDLVGIGYEEHEYASKFLRNELPDTAPLDYYAVIYAVPDDADVFDIEQVKKANPGWGLTVDPTYTASELAKAKVSTAEEIIWRRYRCNQWYGASSTPWIPPNLWKQCLLPFPIEELVGRECFAGLDLSSTSDITALSLVFPETDGSYHVLPWFFVPEKTAEERQRQNRLTPYQKWVGDNLLVATPGSAVDFAYVREVLRMLSRVYTIRQVAIDRGWQGQALMTDISNDGFEIVPFGQGFMSMDKPTKHFEVLARNGKLRHGNNPILNWMLGNVAIRVDEAANIKVDKKRAKDKVDGIISTIMALGIATLCEPVISDPGIY